MTAASLLWDPDYRLGHRRHPTLGTVLRFDARRPAGPRSSSSLLQPHGKRRHGRMVASASSHAGPAREEPQLVGRMRVLKRHRELRTAVKGLLPSLERANATKISVRPVRGAIQFDGPPALARLERISADPFSVQDP